MKHWLKKQKKGTIACFLVGILALCWFLIRVIPKPQRAMYPCQRAAFPIASSFVIWLIGIFSSLSLFKKSRQAFKQVNWISGLALLFLSMGIFTLVMNQRGVKSFALTTLFTPPARSFESLPYTLIQAHSIVSVVKSDKADVRDLSAQDIDALVREAISLAGGLDHLIEDGNSVVLKPNLLTFRTLPYDNQQSFNIGPGSNGIVTDYRVIQSMVNVIREINPSGRITLIEGSAVGSTRSNFSIVGWNRITGLDEVIFLDELCDWQDKNSPALKKVNLPPGKALYSRPSEPNTYYLSRVYYEADVLISLPCLKNHSATGITGAVKNVGIGATPPPIYGWGPQDPSVPNERWNPDNGVDHGTETNRASLHNWIHDWFLARPVDFALMDGLQGIEMGPGGHYGSLASCQENMRLILASHDPVALDAIESLIMGHNPAKVPHLASLYRDGAGTIDPRAIQVVGEEVFDVKKDFRIFGSGLTSKYTDFTGPEVNLEYAELSENSLRFGVSADEEIAKIEILINGKKELLAVVEQFDPIEYELSQAPASISEIEILVYDFYLNGTRMQLSSTGVRNVEKKGISLTCYPVPVSEILHVDFGTPLPSNGILCIHDLIGTEIIRMHVPVGSEIWDLDLSECARGSYLLSLDTDQRKFTRQIIK